MHNNAVIGNGLLAKAFESLSASKTDVCFFASGVSNSSCKDQAEYDREEILLRNTIYSLANNKKLVYFSTCSVYDDSQRDSSKYIQHKIAMEEIVREHPKFNIFRLPQVVGKTNNKNTLVNFIANSIINNAKIIVQKDAVRNIIDVDDVVRLVSAALNSDEFSNQTINISSTRYDSIFTIIEVLGSILNKPAIIEAIDGGSSYRIDTSIVDTLSLQCGICFRDDYLHKTLSKYFTD